MTFLGVDIGTTGAKAIIVRGDGAVLASAYRDYALITPKPGWAELDPMLVWRSARAVIRQAIAAAAVPPRAIGLSGPGEAFVPLDSSGRPVANVIVSFDQRTIGAFERVVADLGPATFETATGLKPLSHYAIFKWLWLRDELSAVDRRTARFASLPGFVAERLGGGPGIDPSLAARTLGYDPIAGDWADPLLARLGIDRGRLPPLRAAGEPCGTVGSGQADRLGIAPNAPIIVAGLDQACAAYAVDVAAGAALLSVGTTAVIAQVGPDRPGPTAIPAVPHLDGRSWLALAGSPGGGSVLRWFRDTWLGGIDGIARPRRARARRPAYEAVIEPVRDHPTGVLFLPHLGGSRIAFADPAAQGAFVGLTFESNERDLARAVLDGVAYEILMLISRVADAGPAPHRLHAAGGGSRSTGWMQIVADAASVAIDSTGSSDVAAYGAARIAARFGVSGRATEGLPPVATRFTVDPRPAWSDYHARRFIDFRKIQGALREARG